MTSQISFKHKNFINNNYNKRLLKLLLKGSMYRPLFQFMANYKAPVNYWKLTLPQNQICTCAARFCGSNPSICIWGHQGPYSQTFLDSFYA